MASSMSTRVAFRSSYADWEVVSFSFFVSSCGACFLTNDTKLKLLPILTELTAGKAKTTPKCQPVSLSNVWALDHSLSDHTAACRSTSLSGRDYLSPSDALIGPMIAAFSLRFRFLSFLTAKRALGTITIHSASAAPSLSLSNSRHVQ